MGQSDRAFEDVINTFDHVVVLMLENRSFDNLLGCLYPDGKNGKPFEGVLDKDGQFKKQLRNPIPPKYQTSGGATEVPVAYCTNKDRYHQPCPDPGEDYPHVNTQLFNCVNAPYENSPPYNLPNPVPLPAMDGFVHDYIRNYRTEYPKAPTPSYDQYKVIMECFDPADVPVFSTLAREFAVFDHWFCSVPSETFCNRAFWHAGTSWGHVINPGSADDPGDQSNWDNTIAWLIDSAGCTIFEQLDGIGKTWTIYSDNKIPCPGGKHFTLPITPLVHPGAWKYWGSAAASHHFKDLADFKNDCANGSLPAYSFIEPNFLNPHNDMHPSTPGEVVDGTQPPGSVLLGEALVWDIYNAIFTSPSHWKNTLLIITFDEHGGCYDHVVPPGYYGEIPYPTSEIAKIATAPDLSPYKKWDEFDFQRLGLRVPTIMVSPYIQRNTIINQFMSHSSFLKTMHRKWNLSSLSVREDASPDFARDTNVLQPTLQRTTKADMPKLPPPMLRVDNTDYSQALLEAVLTIIVKLFRLISHKLGPHDSLSTKAITTQEEAVAFILNTIRKAKTHQGQNDEIRDHDWVFLLKAVAEEIKKKEQP